MFGRALVTVLAAALALSLSGASGADPPILYGSVSTNDAFTIALTNADGTAVTHLNVGTYTIQVKDPATMHDFHLTGSGGVDKTSGLDFVGSLTWTVTFVDGTYYFFCTVHRGSQHGSFTVGTGIEATPPPPPPPVQTLKGTVGPGLKIAFVRTAERGKTKIVIRDLTSRDNFHLVGPGVNKTTGVAFKGTVRWVMTLRAGTYRYRSDAHAALKGVLRVS